MCHTEQKLSGDVMKQGKGGSNPSPGQFLVGGSYLLADEASVREDHTRLLPSKKVCTLPARFIPLRFFRDIPGNKESRCRRSYRWFVCLYFAALCERAPTARVRNAYSEVVGTEQALLTH